MNRKFEDAVPDFEQKRKVVSPIHFITVNNDVPPTVDDEDDDNE
jgi:hypothetical protein